MTSVVWKYELQPGVNTLSLPRGAQLLHIGVQPPERVMLWVRVDALATQHETRWVTAVATGDPFDDPAPLFVGTAHIGPLVFHIFEVSET